ncbi:hypothetical protein UY3_03944 [Chelonia mydas]|uniref:Interleukin-2 receptor subunit alpha n=1 Tax=Chelonia mydas TaxID=8469 RepID=M7BSW2_CHEMY|nr:hypothetical protein UY3_03944 [Chelonia mydas]
MTHYAVGQELHYKCLRGYDARPPTSDISTCKEESGKIFWTKLNLLCTNDSKSGEEMTQPIPITEVLTSTSPEDKSFAGDKHQCEERFVGRRTLPPTTQTLLVGGGSVSSTRELTNSSYAMRLLVAQL